MTGDAAPGVDGWRRLDARMLLVHPLSELVRFLPAIVAALLASSRADLDWAGLVAVALPVIAGVMRWFTWRYRITPHAVAVRRGLLFRSESTAPVDRVRSVDLTSTIWHRLLGLAQVQIGTGQAMPVTLDALSLSRAEALRADILRWRGEVDQVGAPAPDAAGETVGAAVTPPEETVTPPGQTVTPPGQTPAAMTPPAAATAQPAERLIVRGRPDWLRYAPLTLAGHAPALVVIAFLVQTGGDALRSRAGDLAQDIAGGTGPGALVLVAAGLAASTLIALASYLIANHDFRLTRHGDGTLRAQRGLFTRHRTSVEESRLRGAQLAEPLLLRCGRGASASALLSGRRFGEALPLVPSAPRPVVDAVVTEVTGDPEAVHADLIRHGPAATRRRWTRALWPPALAILAVGWVCQFAGLPVGWLVPPALWLAASVGLAADRARRLGHLLTGRHVVARSGSLLGRRELVARDGIVGWSFRTTVFQRRAGLTTLTATTAGSQPVHPIVDLTPAAAARLADAATPGVLAEFLAPATAASPSRDSAH